MQADFTAVSLRMYLKPQEEQLPSALITSSYPKQSLSFNFSKCSLF